LRGVASELLTAMQGQSLAPLTAIEQMSTPLQAASSSSSSTSWPVASGASQTLATYLPVQVLAQLVPGAAHGVTMIAVGYPFDTLKTRMQLRMHGSVSDCLRDMMRSMGPLSLYRGASMPLCTMVTKRPAEFFIFEQFNRKLKGHSSAPFLGGALAGLVAGVMGCPFSVVKIQMQSSGAEVHATTLRAALTIWQRSSWSGFYRGLQASVLMQVPFATMYLGTYGKLREALPKTPISSACAGGAASLLTWTVLQPFDTLRTVIQADVLNPGKPASGWISHLRNIVKARGIQGLWAGWVPVALRSLPTSAASMTVYEWTRSHCDSFVAAS
jgi:hypothetical protein